MVMTVMMLKLMMMMVEIERIADRREVTMISNMTMVTVMTMMMIVEIDRIAHEREVTRSNLLHSFFGLLLLLVLLLLMMMLMDDDDDGDIYIMMKCMSVCLSRFCLFCLPPAKLTIYI